jgi:hypothetical protein
MATRHVPVPSLPLQGGLLRGTHRRVPGLTADAVERRLASPHRDPRDTKRRMAPLARGAAAPAARGGGVLLHAPGAAVREPDEVWKAGARRRGEVRVARSVGCSRRRRLPPSRPHRSAAVSLWVDPGRGRGVARVLIRAVKHGRGRRRIRRLVRPGGERPGRLTSVFPVDGARACGRDGRPKSYRPPSTSPGETSGGVARTSGSNLLRTVVLGGSRSSVAA